MPNQLDPDTQGLNIVDPRIAERHSEREKNERNVGLSKTGVSVSIVIIALMVFAIVFTGGFDRSVLRELDTLTDEELLSMSASQVSDELSRAHDLVERGNTDREQIAPHIERLSEILDEKTDAYLDTN